LARHVEMLDDFSTKSLQGNLFRKFGDVLLGYHHTKSLITDSSTLPEERDGIMQAGKRYNGSIRDDMNDSAILKKEEQIKEGMARVTWADIVKGVTGSSPSNEEREGFESSFSRNNSVDLR
jgi:hypothetical protein